MRTGLGIAAGLIVVALAACRPVAVPTDGADPAAEPKMVRLDFTDRPVAEVLDRIATRGGYNVTLHKDVDRVTRDRRINLKEDRPVPFWEALERLDRAAGLVIDNERGFGGAPSLTLSPLRGVRGPVVIAGLFRCELLEVAHLRTLAFGAEAPPNTQGRTVPTRNGDVGPEIGPTIESLRVRIEIRPEPRGVMLRPAGEPRFDHATDDRGRDMRSDPARQKGIGDMLITGGAGAFVAEMTLDLPDPSGASIRTLRGVVPVDVGGRKVDVEFTFANIPLP